MEIYAYGAIPSNEMEARGGGPAALVNGAKIPTGSFVKKGALAGLFYGSECHIYRFGYFYDTFDRFLGVKFMINGQVHYGWIGFRGVGVLFGLGAQLWGWAYETEPNTSIRAIDPSYTPSISAAEPTSLELLAAGHVAVADWRRRGAIAKAAG